MIKHDAIRRALGAAWVIIFLTTLVLPVGIGGGAARALASQDDSAPAPFVPAQSEFTPALEEAPAAEPPAAPPSQPSAQRTLDSQATLEVRQTKVEVAPPNQEAWADARSGQTVTTGTRIRTDGSGTARLVYFEGSSTTIQTNSGVLVQQLQQTEGGNVITRLLQAAGTTLSRVTSLTDVGARFEVETPAATAFVRGTDLVVREVPRRTASVPDTDGSMRLLQAGAPMLTPTPPPAAATGPQFLFQNVSPTGTSPVVVEGFGRSVTIVGGQETLAQVGIGPGAVRPTGAVAQAIENMSQAAINSTGNQAAQAQAQAALTGPIQQGLVASGAIQRAQVIPPPPPPPPPGLPPGVGGPPPPIIVPPPPINVLRPPGGQGPQSTFANAACVTPTPSLVPTAGPTAVPTSTSLPTSTPTGTPTPPATATITPTATAVPAAVNPCTGVVISGTPTVTTGQFTLQTFLINASLSSARITPNSVPFVTLLTSGGPRRFQCTSVGAGMIGQLGVLVFNTVCQGTTSPFNILPGSLLTVSFPVTPPAGGPLGATIDVTTQAPVNLALNQSDTLTLSLYGVDEESLVPAATMPRAAEIQPSLFHAAFDSLRHSVEASRPDPAVGALVPTGNPLLGALAPAASPLLGGLALQGPGAVALAAERSDSLARPDVTARRDDGAPERLGWRPERSPTRL